MFRFSSDSNNATATNIQGFNRNSKFMRSNSSLSSHNPIRSNTPHLFDATTTTSNKHIPSPLMNKYKSNQATTTDTESLISRTSNITYTNSTIATSVSNSPPNQTKLNHAKSNINNNTTTRGSGNLEDESFNVIDDGEEENGVHDDYSSYYDERTSAKRAPSIQSSQLSQNNQNQENVSIYELIRLDTSVSLESYYVEQNQEQYQVKLTLDQRQIELLRYTWNQMLLEESSNSDNMPGAFTNNPSTSPFKKTPKSKTNTKIESSIIASSLFCRQFYFNLLSKDSELEKMFPSIKHQAVSFAGILTFTISQLENLSNLSEYLSKLGKLHARILNIEAPQFQLMGEALIQTFQERFGKKFNKELENLWIKLYLYLANTLLQYGIDPVLKLSRYESNGSYLSNSTNNIDLVSNTISQESSLRDDLTSLDVPNPNSSASSLAHPHHHNGNPTASSSVSSLMSSSSHLPKHSNSKLIPHHALLNLQDMTILELKPGFKKKIHTRVKKAKGDNCVIM